MSGPFSWATRFLAGGALLLALFLLVGLALPGTWDAERSIDVAASPDEVFAWLDAPEAWRRWTAWPDSGLVAEGPARGPGARIAWNDLELGDGSFEIVEARAPELVRYRVVVQEGSMRTEGALALAPVEGGTRITWREEGDFGRNPLMGYWARAMSSAQGRELERSLIRLEALAEGATPAPGS